MRLQAPQPLEVLAVEDGDQRRSVTVEQLTEAVFTLCLGTEKTLERDLHELRDGLLQDVDQDVALAELFMLSIYGRRRPPITCMT